MNENPLTIRIGANVQNTIGEIDIEAHGGTHSPRTSRNAFVDLTQIGTAANRNIVAPSTGVAQPGVQQNPPEHGPEAMPNIVLDEVNERRELGDYIVGISKSLSIAYLQKQGAILDRPVGFSQGALGIAKSLLTTITTYCVASDDPLHDKLANANKWATSAEVPIPLLRILKSCLDICANCKASYELHKKFSNAELLEKSALKVLIDDHKRMMVQASPLLFQHCIIGGVRLILRATSTFQDPAAQALTGPLLQLAAGGCSALGSLATFAGADTSQTRALTVQETLHNPPEARVPIDEAAEVWLDNAQAEGSVSGTLYVVLREHPRLLNAFVGLMPNDQGLTDLALAQRDDGLPGLCRRFYWAANPLQGTATGARVQLTNLIAHIVERGAFPDVAEMKKVIHQAGVRSMTPDPRLHLDQPILSAAQPVEPESWQDFPDFRAQLIGRAIDKEAVERIRKLEEAAFGKELRAVLRSKEFGEADRRAFSANYHLLSPDAQARLKALFAFDRAWFSSAFLCTVDNPQYGKLVGDEERQFLRLTMAREFARDLGYTNLVSEEAKRLQKMLRLESRQASLLAWREPGLQRVAAISEPSHIYRSRTLPPLAEKISLMEDRHLDKISQTRRYARSDAVQAANSVTFSLASLLCSTPFLQVAGMATSPYLLYLCFRGVFLAGGNTMQADTIAQMRNDILAYAKTRQGAPGNVANVDRAGARRQVDSYSSIYSHHPGGPGSIVPSHLPGVGIAMPDSSLMLAEPVIDEAVEPPSRRMLNPPMPGGVRPGSGPALELAPKPLLDIKLNPFYLAIEISDALAQWRMAPRGVPRNPLLKELFRIPLLPPSWLALANMDEPSRIKWIIEHVLSGKRHIRFASTKFEETDKAPALVALKGLQDTGVQLDQNITLAPYLAQAGYECMPNHGTPGLDSLIYAVLQSLNNRSYSEDDSMSKQFERARSAVVARLADEPGERIGLRRLDDPVVLSAVKTACCAACERVADNVPFTFVKIDADRQIRLDEDTAAYQDRRVICAVDTQTNQGHAIFGVSSHRTFDELLAWQSPISTIDLAPTSLELHGLTLDRVPAQGQAANTGARHRPDSAFASILNPHHPAEGTADLGEQAPGQLRADSNVGSHGSHYPGVRQAVGGSPSKLSFAFPESESRAETLSKIRSLGQHGSTVTSMTGQLQTDTSVGARPGAVIATLADIGSLDYLTADYATGFFKHGPMREKLDAALAKTGRAIKNVDATPHNSALVALLIGLDPNYRTDPSRLLRDVTNLRLAIDTDTDIEMLNATPRRPLHDTNPIRLDDEAMAKRLIRAINAYKGVNLTYRVMLPPPPDQPDTDWVEIPGPRVDDDEESGGSAQSRLPETPIVLFKNLNRYHLVLPI